MQFWKMPKLWMFGGSCTVWVCVCSYMYSLRDWTASILFFIYFIYFIFFMASILNAAQKWVVIPASSQKSASPVKAQPFSTDVSPEEFVLVRRRDPIVLSWKSWSNLLIPLDVRRLRRVRRLERVMGWLSVLTPTVNLSAETKSLPLLDICKLLISSTLKSPVTLCLVCIIGNSFIHWTLFFNLLLCAIW